MSMIRTRWAAIGAAVAITLGAGGLTFVDAAKDSGDRPVTVLLDNPCRMLDTRADKGIGGRTTPIGPADVHTVTATGTSGNCTIPTDALGLVGNATAVNASEATNLRFYPADAATYPGVSNLNPRPGAPPTPNGVTVGLSNTGEFNIRNAKGTVDVIVDITAYLVHHTHDDLYYTEDEIDVVVDDLKYISLDPAGFHKMGTAKYYDNVGLDLSDGTAQVSFGFTLPPDHTPGGDFDFTLLWRAADTDCTADEFDLNFIYANRYGQPPFGIFMDKIAEVDPPHGAHNIQRVTWRTDDQNNMQPGDAVLITIDRVVQPGCTGDVTIGGAFATYD